MSKISVPISNNFCPQTLFLYGTYRKDGTPNFGLFCWFSYCWNSDLGVMASIGGDKLTKDRIKDTGIFSANLVTEEMLPLADYLGSKEGYSADKMNIDIEITKGSILNVPVLACSPLTFELEVTNTISLDGSDVFLCKVSNVLAEQSLIDETKTSGQKLKEIAPISTTCSTYFSWNGNAIGTWGEPQNNFDKIK